ncbi:MAG TPA: DUF6152 family protein [Steroidobacteraceae bacterium]|nr:DUF6152 family protein [Steroidobacteraceae bacterium]
MRNLMLTGTLLALSGAALAHHSFAMFDKTRTVNIDGVIKNVEWNNPHVWIWVTVPNQNGGSDDWGLESGGPSQMNRMGLRRSVFKTGDKISVEVYPMKDGRVGGQLSKATLADGTKIDVMKSVKAFAAGGQTVEGGETPAQ